MVNFKRRSQKNEQVNTELESLGHTVTWVMEFVFKHESEKLSNYIQKNVQNSNVIQ